MLGRTDDVINVAGHRLGTREIEEAVQAHSDIAEVAVVGVADALKGQVPIAFAVVKDAPKAATPELAAALEKEVMATVDRELGAIARPSRVHFVTVLPKTRSGQAAAPLHPGDLRGPRPGRPHHHRGPGRAGADPGPGQIRPNWIPAYAGMTAALDPRLRGDDRASGHLQGPRYLPSMCWVMFITLPFWFMAIFMSMLKPSPVKVILLSAVISLHTMV